MGLVKVSDASRYGAIKTDQNGKVTNFYEKPSNKFNTGVINAGVYIFRRSTIEDIPQDKNISLENDIIPQLVSEHKVMSITIEEDFIDIGVPESYQEAQQFFK